VCGVSGCFAVVREHILLSLGFSLGCEVQFRRCGLGVSVSGCFAIVREHILLSGNTFNNINYCQRTQTEHVV
jgi:hypothetical protein